MNILLPKNILPIMLGPATNIPVVDSAIGEVAWVTGTDYAVKDRRVDSGYVYECVKPVTGAPQNTYAPSDPRSAGYWLIDKRNPTNRTAPFDKYPFTKARRVGSVVYQISIPFVTGIAIYGIEGDTISVTVKDPNGVDLIPPVQSDLWEQAYGEWEYLFGSLRRKTYFTLKNLPVHPQAVFTITVARNTPSETAAIGFISAGNWKQFLAPVPNAITGAQYGVEATTRDYSTYTDYEDGTYEEIEGRKATDYNLTCVISADEAPNAMSLLSQILGKAVAIEVSDLPKYSHLATVGKVTGTVRSVDWPTAEVDLQITGNAYD